MWITILQIFLHLLNHTGGKEFCKSKSYVLLVTQWDRLPSFKILTVFHLLLILILFLVMLCMMVLFSENIYGQQKGKSFKPITKSEVQIFMGINFLVSIKKCPSYRDYWSANICLRCDFIANAMSRTRFELILTHLHLNDNTFEVRGDDPQFHRLYKVRPFLDCLTN